MLAASCVTARPLGACPARQPAPGRQRQQPRPGRPARAPLRPQAFTGGSKEGNGSGDKLHASPDLLHATKVGWGANLGCLGRQGGLGRLLGPRRLWVALRPPRLGLALPPRCRLTARCLLMLRCTPLHTPAPHLRQMINLVSELLLSNHQQEAAANCGSVGARQGQEECAHCCWCAAQS